MHLNDQNGIQYDQDKSFGVENLGAAFNQVKVLKENGYKHLENSLKIFKAHEAKADKFDYAFRKQCAEKRNFEALEMYVMNLLMGLE